VRICAYSPVIVDDPKAGSNLTASAKGKPDTSVVIHGQFHIAMPHELHRNARWDV
jgi:hypothetical protein